MKLALHLPIAVKLLVADDTLAVNKTVLCLMPLLCKFTSPLLDGVGDGRWLRAEPFPVCAAPLAAPQLFSLIFFTIKFDKFKDTSLPAWSHIPLPKT